MKNLKPHPTPNPYHIIIQRAGKLGPIAKIGYPRQKGQWGIVAGRREIHSQLHRSIAGLLREASDLRRRARTARVHRHGLGQRYPVSAVLQAAEHPTAECGKFPKVGPVSLQEKDGIRRRRAELDERIGRKAVVEHTEIGRRQVVDPETVGVQAGPRPGLRQVETDHRARREGLGALVQDLLRSNASGVIPLPVVPAPGPLVGGSARLAHRMGNREMRTGFYLHQAGDHHFRIAPGNIIIVTDDAQVAGEEHRAAGVVDVGATFGADGRRHLHRSTVYYLARGFRIAHPDTVGAWRQTAENRRASPGSASIDAVLQ